MMTFLPFKSVQNMILNHKTFIKLLDFIIIYQKNTPFVGILIHILLIWMKQARKGFQTLRASLGIVTMRSFKVKQV